MFESQRVRKNKKCSPIFSKETDLDAIDGSFLNSFEALPPEEQTDIIKRSEQLQDHLIKVQQRDTTKSANNDKMNNKSAEPIPLQSYQNSITIISDW